MDVLTTDLPGVRLAALTWGPTDDVERPLAVLLHGFPDTAHTWRHLGPALAGAGYRVVAPFTRGYAPSGLPADGCYHVAALMADAAALHTALRGDRRALLVGHDWGAITANGLAAYDASPFSRVVAMAVPPVPALTPARGDLGRWLRTVPRQLRMSWYTAFNQLPRLPERSFDRLVAHLWRAWSPGYDATADLAHLASALPDDEHRSAAIGYYRAQARQRRVPDRYRAYLEAWTGAPRVPVLYLHGADDGCLDVRWVAGVERHLPAGSLVAVVAGAGHFLQLEQPDTVAARVLEFVEQEEVR